MSHHDLMLLTTGQAIRCGEIYCAHVVEPGRVLNSTSAVSTVVPSLVLSSSTTSMISSSAPGMGEIILVRAPVVYPFRLCHVFWRFCDMSVP